MSRGAVLALLASVSLAGCSSPAASTDPDSGPADASAVDASAPAIDADSPDAIDGAPDAMPDRRLLGPLYSYPGVGREMCALNLDHATRTDAADVVPMLDDAVKYGAVLHLFAHKPGNTVTTARIEAVLAAAHERGIPFVTYGEIARGEHDGPGLAFSFDDQHLEPWIQMRPVIARYGARLTFFFTRYPIYTATEKELVLALARDGHDIQFHGAAHRHAVDYKNEHGLARYLADEIDVGMAAMRADGWEPTVFAYPFGEHDAEIQAALLERFALVRSIRQICTR
jgi:hypothetical protein